MQKDELERRVAELEKVQSWNHNFILPYSIETRPGNQTSHGKNLVKLERLKPIFNLLGLENKSVLDVGCNEGFFSFCMADANARVLGIDIDKDRIEKAKFVKSALNSSKADFQIMDIYSKKFQELPRFDLCLNLGFLHRVPDPYSAMEALVSKADLIVFEWKALKFGPHDDAFAYFSPKEIDVNDYYGTEYWLLSYVAVERILKRLGMNNFYRVDDPAQRRAILVAGRVNHPIFKLPNRVCHRGRLAALASHTKRYLRTIFGILSGRVNA
ncbi:MAG: methyltransferase domain-containing protein [Gammaproteobacteria bacterium]|nr:methyltransferase domain-containing protein [Gammaproteobacteria bacterium]